MASSKHDEMHVLGDAADWRCFHCGCRVKCRTCEPENLKRRAATRDHLVARSLGGGGGTNIVLSCFACNQKKAARPVGVPKHRVSAATGGCMKQRDGKPGRKVRRPRTSFPTRKAAEAMCLAVQTAHDRRVEPYLCEQCDDWHIRTARLSREDQQR